MNYMSNLILIIDSRHHKTLTCYDERKDNIMVVYEHKDTPTRW